MTLLVYARVAGYEFVWDDNYFIVHNPSIRSLSNLPGYFTDIKTMTDPAVAESYKVYRPLRNISYWVDHSLFGLSPAGWHLHNLILHLINGGLVYLVFLRWGGKRLGGAFAAALFLLHPIQTEAVAWVKCRDDLLSVMGALIGALWLIRPPRAGYLAGAHLFSCLAKVQSVAVLPVLLWFRPPVSRKSRLGALGLLGISILYLLVRHRVLGGSAQTEYLAGNLFRTLLNMGPVLWEYLRLIVWPVDQLADYVHMGDDPVSIGPALAAWGGILAGSTAFFWFSRSHLALKLAGLWVAASMLPVMNIIPMKQYMAERFLYLPMVGVCLMAGVGLDALIRKTSLVSWTLALGIPATMCLLTHQRLPVWENKTQLYHSIVQSSPEPAFRPQRNLLFAYVQTGNLAEADLLSETMLQDEKWTDGQRADLLQLRSRVLKMQKRPPEDFRRLLEEARTLGESDAINLVDLAVLHAISESFEEAIRLFTLALEKDPGNAASILMDRGTAYRNWGKLDLAEADFRQSLSRTPQRKTFFVLGSLLWTQKRFAEAKEVYSQGMEEFPSDPEFITGRDLAAEKARQQALQENTL